jgi:predicted amidohydrolase
MTMTEVLNVSVVQSPAELVGPQARLNWLAEQLAEHSAKHLDLLVLPELFQCGYNIGEEISTHAEAPDGPFAKAIASLAQKYGAAICYGYAERQGEVLFNSAQCIDASGASVGHHRKLLLPPGFEGEHFCPGSECALFPIGDFKVAFLICYDVEFPETARHLALAGADLIVVPTALGAQWSFVAEKLIPSRAFENGVFICYANYSGQDNGMLFHGGSCIIGPDGADLVRAKGSGGMMFAQLNKLAVEVAQNRLPYQKDFVKLPWINCQF